MIATLVYVLCALTSVGCAILLFKSYAKSRARLLFWSGWCFVSLGISNIILFLDFVIVPGMDLSIHRTAATIVGVALLLYGLIWETS